MDIEVHPETKQFTSVELWVSYGVCKTPDGSPCDGVGWPNAQLRPSGDVYTIGDYPSTDDPQGRITDEKVVRTDTIVDGVAQLHLDTVPGAETPYVIAVVGLDGTKAVGAKILSPVEIPTDDQAHWRIDLHDVGDVTADTSTDPGDAGLRYNALVWARNSTTTLDATGYAGCLAYQKWTGTEWETMYFVPSSDPDCDGNPPDCNPYWYNASTSNARCVAPGGPTNDICMAGAYSCRAETDHTDCALDTQPRICVPSNVCASCKGSDDLASCVKDEIISGSTTSAPLVPVQRCTMDATDNGPCSNNTMAAGWHAMFVLRGAACMPKTATGPAAALRLPSAPFSGNTASLMISGGAILVVHAAPESASTQGCNVEITWVQGLPPLGPLPIVVAVFYGPTTEMLVPVVLDFSPPANMVCPINTNNTPQQCQALGSWPVGPSRGDSMFDCSL